MIKLTAAISKRRDWTREEWLTHYRERHASLTASVPNFTRHGLRYLQNYALHAPAIPDFPETDTGRVAVTELWYADIERLRAAYREPDYLAYLRADELRFCDFTELAAGVARETRLFEAPGVSGDKRHAYLPRAKIFVFRTAGTGIARARLQERWLTERGPQIVESGHFSRHVRRYVQSRMLDVDIGIPGSVRHALIDELWFRSADEAVAYWSAYRESAAERRADAALLEPGGTRVVFAEEHEVFGPLPVP